MGLMVLRSLTPNPSIVVDFVGIMLIYLRALLTDPADNMKDLLNHITNKEMSTAKRMGYVNNFTKVYTNFKFLIP